MNTVAVVLLVILTASWWFRRNVARSPAPNPSIHLHPVPDIDRPSADSARRGAAAIPRMPLALVQNASDEDRLPSPRWENGLAAGGAGPQFAMGEIHSPIRRRFLELRGEAAAIVERHREQQAQLNDQLARKLSAIREELERLQHDANVELETINPKLPLNLICRARRDNGG